MAIAIDAVEETAYTSDRLCGASRSSVIDRWIYVFTAASFIAIVLTGFIPDSLSKLAAIHAGAIPPFPLALHFHAVLMASFLLLLLAQTVLVATGRRDWHMQLGIAGAILVPCIVVATLFAVPAVYHNYWNAAHAAAPARPQLLPILPILENILLLQLRIAVIFPVLMAIALSARTRDPGLHKRLVFLAVVPLLAAAVDRIDWLPNFMPQSPLSSDIYVLLAVSPMFVWDLARNRDLHRAYWIFAGLFLPLSVAVYSVWDSPWWHATARHIMGV